METSFFFKLKPLTNKKLKWYANEENCHISKQTFEDKHADD